MMRRKKNDLIFNQPFGGLNMARLKNAERKTKAETSGKKNNPFCNIQCK